LSRDRPETLKQAINSVLAQNKSTAGFELIVSDNSENEDVRRMISKNYGNNDFKLIIRNPSLSSREHFQIIVSELDRDYAVLFHDDDIMHPNYVEAMSSFLDSSNQVASAIGCNASVFKKDILQPMYQMHSFDCIKRFDNQSDFLSQYLFGRGGKAPFPGYMYNTRFLKKIPIALLPCGKHGDVTLLSSLLKCAPIFWLPNSLMHSRLHGLNDNNTYSVPNRICLLNYMVKSGLMRDDESIVLFRCDFWYKWFVGQSIKNIFLWKNRVVLKFLSLKFFYFMTKKIFWKGFAARIKKDFL